MTTETDLTITAIEGRTIVGVRCFTQNEMARLAVNKPDFGAATGIVLDDGTILIAAEDDQARNAGELFRLVDVDVDITATELTSGEELHSEERVMVWQRMDGPTSDVLAGES